jgi:hypothetical protein
MRATIKFPQADWARRKLIQTYMGRNEIEMAVAMQKMGVKPFNHISTCEKGEGTTYIERGTDCVDI